jgi:hypothetical protein
MAARICEARIDDEAPHEAVGRTRSLVTGEFINVCPRHYAFLREQGLVGMMTSLRGLVIDHQPTIVLSEPDFYPRDIEGAHTLAGAECTQCGLRLDKHTKPPVFVDEQGRPFRLGGRP